MFPISRDPPEGGTVVKEVIPSAFGSLGFQFLGIPPKGEQEQIIRSERCEYIRFPISRDPPEGGTFEEEAVVPSDGL